VARNVGLDSVTTPWIAYCDDDDLWHPTKLMTQLGMARGVDWITCCEAEFFVTRGGRPRIEKMSEPASTEEVQARLRRRISIPGGTSGLLARTDLIQTVGGYRDLPMGEDLDLWRRLADRSPIAIAPERLVGVRLHPRSLTTDVRELRRQTDELASPHAGFDESQPAVPATADTMRWYADLAGRSGQRRLAISLQWEAARSSQRVSDWLAAAATVATPRGVSRFRAFKRRRALPAEERRAIEQWLSDALRVGTV
jgi:hypothetical protein